MSVFDARINVGQIGIETIGSEPDGPVYEAEVFLGVMTAIPVGPNQVLPLPFGSLRFSLDADGVDAVILQLQEARKQMSKRPNITVANSLAGVDKVAELHEKLR